MWKKKIGSYYSWKMNVRCGNNMQTKIKKWHGGVPPHLAIGLYFGNPKYQIVMTIVSTFSLSRNVHGNNFLNHVIDLYLQCTSFTHDSLHYIVT